MIYRRQLLGLSSFMVEDYAKAATLLCSLAMKPNEPTLYYPLATRSANWETEAATRITANGGDGR